MTDGPPIRTIARIRVETLLGIAWMMGALASFLGMAVAGRHVLETVHVSQLLFIRAVIGLLILSLFLPRFGFAALETQRLPHHIGRGVFQLTGQTGWFIGIATIPLTSVFAIEFTIPIWVAVLSAIFLGERLTVPRVVAISLGFAGTMVILRPGMETIQPGAIAVLVASLGFACRHVSTRFLTRTDTTYALMVYPQLLQIPLTGIVAAFFWTWPGLDLWLWIIPISIFALSAEFCMARAFRLAEATVVVPFDFLRLPLGAVIGFMVFGEPLQALVFAGAVVIFGGNLLMVWSERERKT